MKALTLNCVGTEELLGKACDTMIVYAQFLGSRPVEVTGLPLHWTDATMLEGTMRNLPSVRSVDIQQRISIAMHHCIHY